MERVVFDISWDGLADAKSPRVRLTWFKKLLCVSPLCFGWVAFEFYFFHYFFIAALPSFYESHLLIHICSISPNLFEKHSIFHQFLCIRSSKKIKVRPRLINSGDVQSSRFLVLFIFESCDLPSLWSSSVTRLRDHGLSSSQDQVYQAGHRYARSSAHALLKPRLRGQMLNTSNPISVWQDLKGSGPATL